MISDLIRIHHAAYRTDLPFWIQYTQGWDPVLEVGCGHGRVTLPLLKAGRIVVGVDRDLAALEYLKSTLGGASDAVRQRARLVNEDILSFVPGISFGAVIIPCNTYSTFNPSGRLKLLKSASSWLGSGGKLIFSLANPLQTTEIFNDLHDKRHVDSPEIEETITHPETGHPVQISSRLRSTADTLLWDWIYDHLHPNGQVEREMVTVEHFLVSKQEILSELQRENFEAVHCLGDYSGEPYSDSSPYLIVVCRHRSL